MTKHESDDNSRPHTSSAGATVSERSAGLNRRLFLKATAGAHLATVVAGCSLDGSDGTNSPAETFRAPDLTPGEHTRFDEAIRFGDAYTMTLEQTTDDGTDIAVSGRFHGSDHALQIEMADRRVENYVVDGDTYVRGGGTCVRYPGVASMPDGAESGGGDADVPTDPEAYPELTVRGSVRRDGEEFVELVLPADALEGFDEQLTYAVSASTYYLRRLETPSLTVAYDSWGEVDPIEPPAMDCQPSA